MVFKKEDIKTALIDISFYNCYEKYFNHLEIDSQDIIQCVENQALILDSLGKFLDEHHASHGFLIQMPVYDDDFEEEIVVKKADFPMAIFTQNIMMGFLREYQRSHPTLSKIRDCINCLRAFFTFAHKKSYIVGESPMEYIKSPVKGQKLPYRVMYRSPLELLEDVLAQINPKTFIGLRNYCIALLLAETGMFVKDLALLNRWEFNEEYSIIERADINDTKVRYLLSMELVESLRAYLNHEERERRGKDHYPENNHEAIFLNLMGERFSWEGIESLFDRFSETINQLGGRYAGKGLIKAIRKNRKLK